MNRLEQVRRAVDAILLRQSDVEERHCGFVHLYGVSAVCVLLAVRRGLDSELCATAGMLHDISSYETGDPTDHATRSASRARSLLVEVGGFSDEEIRAIAGAILTHSAKKQIDGPVAELIKDADVLQHYLYNSALRDSREVATRLQRVLQELGVPIEDSHMGAKGRCEMV